MKSPSRAWLAFDGWSTDRDFNPTNGFVGDNFSYLADYGAFHKAKRATSASYGRFNVHGMRFNVLYCDGHVWASPGYPALENEIGDSVDDRPNAYWAEW